MEQVIAIENRLQNITDQQLNDDLSCYSIYEYINHEKITPSFLKLAKIGKSESLLSDVRDADGTPFADNDAQNEYIVGYYENVYKKPPQEQARPSIEEFLGPQVLATDVVRNAKVGLLDRELLEMQLSLVEIDQSINQCKSSTAPGSDGFGYRFLKQFWQLLRVPLFRYAAAAFETGALTDSFRTASIRLIPKKGEASDLKNWRPISLLNCSYKVLSRAINNRLKTVSDTLLSRAQKGFTNTRKIHEVLINTIESISFANATGTPLAVLSLDQAKAFDTIDHDYLHEVLDFFGFGPNFIRMIMTATTNRKANIILPDGTTSRSFKLERGNSQGDCPSPLLFNLCEQILLFKLELDTGVAGFNENLGIVVQHFPVQNGPFRYESNKETQKANAFADDANCNLVPDPQNLNNVQRILIDFGNLSGLRCNLDKTTVLFAGTGGAIPAGLENIGFRIVDRITLLGFEISWDLSGLQIAFDKAVDKMRKICNFWHRFRLSLTGRINIAKTFLYSQIAYPGAILAPDNEQYRAIEQIITGFVNTGTGIAKDRFYTDTAHGGLGLINPKDFICGLQADWVKSALKRHHDTWSHEIMSLTFGNPAILDPVLVDRDRHPIIHQIAESWHRFNKAFTGTGSNFFESYILYNPVIDRIQGQNSKINTLHFRQNPPLDSRRVAKLRVCDFYGNGPLSLAQVRTGTGLEISAVTHMRITTAITGFLATRAAAPSHLPPANVADFVLTFKKGTKRYRKFFAQPLETRQRKLAKIQQSFLRTVNLPEEAYTQDPARLWFTTLYTNRQREFLFKFYNNRLMVGTRMSHVLEQYDRSCTFCVAKGLLPAPEETFDHLFWSCPYTGDMIDRFLESYIPEIAAAPEIAKKNFLILGKNIGAANNPGIVSLAASIFLYTIWEYRKHKKAPGWQTFLLAYSFEFEKLAKKLSHRRLGLDSGAFYLCRRWNGARQ